VTAARLKIEAAQEAFWRDFGKSKGSGSVMNLVTGGTGLLGSHIVEKLCQSGQKVRALVRRGSDTSFLEGLGVEKAYGDVTDAASVLAAMRGVRVVYHAAARVGDWGPWQEFEDITIRGTGNMVQAAIEAKVDRFLHISSISAYGHVDGAGLVLDETAPLGVNLSRWSYYSRAKVAAEQVVWTAHKRGLLPLTVIRPSWLYGERDRASMPRLIRAIRRRKTRLLGDGANRLNLTYAGNEADGCILAANAPKAVGQAYNLCNDGQITQAQYFNRIAQEISCPPVTRTVPYKVAHSAAFMMECMGHLFGRKTPPLVTRYSVWLIGRQVFFSTDKIRRELGYVPAVGYDEGIHRSVAWALANSRC
jgi:nucleoside-diphosphate-sugar epimerase